MKTFTTIALLLACAIPRQARAQVFPPLVFDASRLGLAIKDYAKQQIPQMVTSELATLRSFDHFRQVTQHVGVKVFRAAAALRALDTTPLPRASPDYEHIYAPAYAPGIPEKEQNRAARARMDEMTMHHLTELDSITLAMRHIHGQLLDLNEEMNAVLKRPVAATADSTSHVSAEVTQLEAAVQSRSAHMMALHARATALQSQHTIALELYEGQRAPRAQLAFQRGAREIAGPSLTAPFIPEPQYAGVQNFLRFPGLKN